MRSRSRPRYPLDEVKRLAADRRLMIAGRPRRFILNRYGITNISGFVSTLIAAIEPENFRKSDELRIESGVFADIYSGVHFEGEEWYVKLYIDGGETCVVILSANWDGYIH